MKQIYPIAALLAVAIGFRLFLWKPFMEWLDKLKNEGKETEITTIQPGGNVTLQNPTGQPIVFSVWRKGDYQAVLKLNIPMKLLQRPEVIVEELRDSGLTLFGFNATKDNMFLGAIKQCAYQTVVNQVITVWANTQTSLNHGTDFLGFAKEALSDESYADMLEYVTNLPLGFTLPKK